MQRFIEGVDRGQSTLLPECLEDWVEESNPVRAVDAFVGALDLAELGFKDVEPAATGRPGYHPAPLLKLYIYGYLNRIQSSRRLEREARRNLEVIWLLQRLSPDDKQDDRRLSPRQRPRHQEGVREVRRALPADGLVDEGECRHRRLEVQSGQHA